MEYNFEGRAPSVTQVRARVRNAVAMGHDTIRIEWGENSIDLEFSEYLAAWTGSGWIRRISGDDIARELNRGFSRVPYDFLRGAA
jgi:hypothetical protein